MDATLSTAEQPARLSGAFDGAAKRGKEKPSPLRLIAKGVASVLLAGTALSTILQFAPGLVSDSAADYIAGKGYNSLPMDAFQAQDIRVYERGNPLVPFHMAGHAVRRMWSSDENFTVKAFGAPFILHDGFSDGLGLLRSDSKLAAYSYSTYEQDARERSVMIWPSDDTITPQQWLREMTGLDVAQLNFGTHSTADMQRILAETNLLHEMRHGDQNKQDHRTLKESDADAYSLHAATLAGAQQSLVGEARMFLMATRTVSAVLSGNESHATAFALRRGMKDDFNRHSHLHDFSLQMRASQDGSTFVSAHHILSGIKFDNDAIPTGMDSASAYYHAATALLDAGIAQRNDENSAIALYVQAMDYLDAISGGTLIDRNADSSQIDVSDYRDNPEEDVEHDIGHAPQPHTHAATQAAAKIAAPKPRV